MLLNLHLTVRNETTPMTGLEGSNVRAALTHRHRWKQTRYLSDADDATGPYDQMFGQLEETAIMKTAVLPT